MNDFDVSGTTIDNGSYILINKDQTDPNSKDAFLFIVNG
jgi:hypothetical protein